MGVDTDAIRKVVFKHSMLATFFLIYLQNGSKQFTTAAYSLQFSKEVKSPNHPQSAGKSITPHYISQAARAIDKERPLAPLWELSTLSLSNAHARGY